MPRAGERNGSLHGFTVANLADQDHIRCRAHRAAQGAGKGLGVQAHLALVHDGLLVGMQKLDRILDGQNVVRRGFIAIIDHRRESGGFAGARGAHHENHAALQHDQLFEDLGHAEVLEPGHFRGDVAQHHGGVAPLIENVDPESAEAGLRNREIDFQLLVEILDLFLGHQAQRRLAHRLGTQDLLVDRKYLALDLDFNGRIAGKEQVGRFALDHQLEQRLGVHHLSRGFGGRRHGLEHLAFFFLEDLQRLAGFFRVFHFSLALELDPQAQLVLRIRVSQSVFIGDQSRFVQLEQRLIEGLHPKPVGTRHHILDFGDIAFEDQIRDQRRVQHDFHGSDAPGPRLARYQALRDECAYVQAQIHQQLLAPFFGKEVDDAVDGLVRAVGVQGGQHQVPGLGELDAVFHGLAVADFADENHIRRLAQGVLEGQVPALAIDADFAVSDHAALVGVHVFHWIFDGDDVATGFLVAVADHGGERGGLAGPGAPDQNHEAALGKYDLLQYGGQLELFERRYLGVDGTKHRAGETLLHEGADAEAADSRRRYGEIAFLAGIELLGLPVVHDGAHQAGTL